MRKILHVDMDAFFAQVEQRDNIKFRNKPIIIGSGNKNIGVVSTCSYEARKYGVKSAMPSKTAYKLCPDGIFVRQNTAKYREVAREIREIFFEISPKVEISSIDEAYIDVTENYLGSTSAIKVAMYIKKTIFERLNLTCSVGISYNKFLAKIGSDMNKPNGLFIIKPEDASEFIDELKISKIPGVGKVAQLKMQILEINTCKEFKEYDKKKINKYFGKLGDILLNYTNGIDNREVNKREKQKSISNETTLPSSKILLFQTNEILIKQLNAVHIRLINGNYLAKTVVVKVKYQDFTMFTRSITLDEYTDNINQFEMQISKLLEKFPTREKKIRLIGIGLSNFIKKEQFKKKVTVKQLQFDI